MAEADEPKKQDDMISATFSLAIFTALTLLYFVARYYIVDRHINGSATNRMVINILYFLAAIGSQLVVNIKNTTKLCHGTPQTNTAILYTLVPNFFILGSVLFLLEVFPGWKAPFSNTIGYGIVWLMGVSDVFADILTPDPNTSGSKLIDKICQDHAIIINELSPINFFSFLGRMSKDGLLVKGWRHSRALQFLWENLSIKNLIAEMIWYLLTGILVISTTYNSLLDITCNVSPQRRQAATAKFEREQAARATPKAKYFTIHD